MTREEQETIINFNEAEKTASVYTHNAALIRKLDRLCIERPNEVKRCDGGHDISPEYIVPKKYVKLNAPPLYTDEQRAKMAENAKRLHAAKEEPPCKK